MNNTFYSQNDYRNYIAHFGVKGMKWGVRRYQNSNGSYTSAGKKRYGVGDGKSYSPVGRRGGGKSAASSDQRAARRSRLKKAALAVGGAAALAGAGYLGYKYGRGALKAYRSGGWNVEGKPLGSTALQAYRPGAHGQSRARGGFVKAAKFRPVGSAPGKGEAIKRFASGAAGKVRDAAGSAASNVRGRFNRNPKLPSTALKVPGRGDAARRFASNAAKGVRNAASNAAFNARSARVSAGNAARDFATNAKGRFNRNPKLPSTALKVPGRGDAARRFASNAAKGVRNAASNAAFNARSASVAAGSRVRNALGSIENTPRNRAIARGVGAAVGGTAGYAAGRAARNAYNNRKKKR